MMLGRFARFGAVLVGVLSLVFLAGPGSVASAAPAYGPAGGTAAVSITVSVDPATEVVTVTVSGTGFDPSEVIVIDVFSQGINVGQTHADATGAFSDTVTLPAGLAAGTHTIVATGQTSGKTASASFTLAQPSGGTSNGDQNGGGNGSSTSSPGSGSNGSSGSGTPASSGSGGSGATGSSGSGGSGSSGATGSGSSGAPGSSGSGSSGATGSGSSAGTGSGLAFTGTDTVAVSTVAGIALGRGGLMVLASRRRRNQNWT